MFYIIWYNNLMINYGLCNRHVQYIAFWFSCVPSFLSFPFVPDKTVTVSVSVLYLVKLLQDKISMWVKPIHISIFDNLQLEQEEGTLKTPVLFDQQIYKVRGFSTTNTNAWKPLKTHNRWNQGAGINRWNLYPNVRNGLTTCWPIVY
jgi:hypothetical protein